MGCSAAFLRICLGISKLTFNEIPQVSIETGTYRGDSTLKIARFFKKTYTIELSEKWYNVSKSRLRNIDNVICYHGDSVDVLYTLLPTIKEPVVFFLDAHYSGGDTEFGREEVPLLRELELICHRAEKDIIIIDDLCLLGRMGDCGLKGDPVFPLMKFDWRNITIRKIARITGKGIRNVRMCLGNRIVIFRNQTLGQNILLVIMAMSAKIFDFFLQLPKYVSRRPMRCIK